MKFRVLPVVALTTTLLACTPPINTREDTSTVQKQPVRWVATLSDSCLYENPEAQDRMAPIVATALAGLIDWGVGSLVDKIQDAAVADRTGYNATFQSQTLFFHLESGQAAPAACMHIAQGKVRQEAASDANWCSGTKGGALCSGLTNDQKTIMDSVGEKLSVDDPTFFAEVRLDYADNKTAMVGQTTAVYYPAILKGGVVAPRDIGITASFVVPSADPAAAKTIATISSVVPSLPIRNALIVRPYGWSVIGWSTVPPKPQMETIAAPGKTQFGATSLKVVVTESPVENQYLQWLAKIVTKDVGDKAKDKLKEAAGVTGPSPADKLTLKTTALEKVTVALTARAAYCQSVTDNKGPDTQGAAYATYVSAALKATAAAKDTDFAASTESFKGLDSATPPADPTTVCSK